MNEPLQLTPLERYWDSILMFDNHEIYTRLSQDLHKEFPQRNPAPPSRAGIPAAFEPDPPSPEEVAEAYSFKYG